jgi:hypothetical protein
LIKNLHLRLKASSFYYFGLTISELIKLQSVNFNQNVNSYDDFVTFSLVLMKVCCIYASVDGFSKTICDTPFTLSCQLSLYQGMKNPRYLCQNLHAGQLQVLQEKKVFTTGFLLKNFHLNATVKYATTKKPFGV